MHSPLSIFRRRSLALLVLGAGSCLLPLGQASADTVQAGQQLATARNCMNCHAIDRKIVGPAYRDVAQKYRTDPTAAARLQTKVMQGGGGVWGVLKMPSNPQLSEADARKLVAWVLSQ